MAWRATPSRPTIATTSQNDDYFGSNVRNPFSSIRRTTNGPSAAKSLRSIVAENDNANETASLRSNRTVVESKQPNSRLDKGKERAHSVVNDSDLAERKASRDRNDKNVQRSGISITPSRAEKRQKLEVPSEASTSSAVPKEATKAAVTSPVTEATSSNAGWFGTGSWRNAATSMRSALPGSSYLASAPSVTADVDSQVFAQNSIPFPSSSSQESPDIPAPSSTTRSVSNTTIQPTRLPRRQSWFGALDPPAQHSSLEPPVSHLSTSASSSTLRVPLTTPSTTFDAAPSASADPPSSASTRTASTADSARAAPYGSYRSWMSTISLSRVAVPMKGPTQAQQIVNSVRQNPTVAPSSVTSSGSDYDTAISSSSYLGDNEATVRVRSISAPAFVDDATVAPRPTRLQLPSIANKRASWWNWAPDESESAPPMVVDTIVEQVEENTAPQLDIETTVPSVVALTTSEPPTKSWMQTFWSDHSDAPISAPSSTRSSSIVTAPVESTHASSSQSGSSSHSVASLKSDPVDPPSPTTALPARVGALNALKNKASWALFPRLTTPVIPNPPAPLVNSIATADVSAQSVIERGTVAKSSSLLKSPLPSLNTPTGSSRASNRSIRTNPSAPNSPLLLPQADAPLKPLTGSIKLTSRLSATDLRLDGAVSDNLVLPSFTDTFLRVPRSYPPRVSSIQKVVSKSVSAMSSYLFSQPAKAALMERGASSSGDCAARLPKALSVMGEARRGGSDGVKQGMKIAIIGVSGWFPTVLKPLFGEPTGTSTKFCQMMHQAVQEHLEDHLSSFNIQTMALNASGIVSDRVEKMYEQLTAREDWLAALRSADTIFLATHSQGTIVSTHLLRKIIESGLSAGGRIHLLAMCGISQGPFVYLSQSYALSPYFQLLESAAARELFEFQDPTSAAAIEFLNSLRTILAHGVKLTSIGSINDQVVPLYSALFAGVDHPAILRAVFVDASAFRTSDFLANLVVFATRLRNAGLSDHDLIFHLSEALAGALTGVGHSTTYESPEVFNLAVRYQFETTLLVDSPTYLNSSAQPPLAMSFDPTQKRNPYLLTWALRGIVEDEEVRDLFGDELTALREAFETWKPTTKILREVKLKLEGIRMLPRARREGKL